MAPVGISLNNPRSQTSEDPQQHVILLADDEAMLRNAATKILDRVGHVVLTAHDGEEALAISRTFPGNIHALVSDVVMPNMDGFALRKRILAERPGIRVLLISAHFDDDSLRGIPFLQKAFRAAQLLEKVRDLLSAPEWSLEKGA